MKNILFKIFILIFVGSLMSMIKGMKPQQVEYYDQLNRDVQKQILIHALENEPVVSLYSKISSLSLVNSSWKINLHDTLLLNTVLSQALFSEEYTEIQKKLIYLYIGHIFSKKSLNNTEKKCIQCLGDKKVLCPFIIEKTKQARIYLTTHKQESAIIIKHGVLSEHAIITFLSIAFHIDPTISYYFKQDSFSAVISASLLYQLYIFSNINITENATVLAILRSLIEHIATDKPLMWYPLFFTHYISKFKNLAITPTK